MKNRDQSKWGVWGIFFEFTYHAMKEEELPVSCIGCGNCKQVYPQSINVPAILKELAAEIAL
jgi:predicted aldo/keto reductase-like oxidoreductase